jgi:glucose-6-phosphate-specific signal transduction histidine kinase
MIQTKNLNFLFAHISIFFLQSKGGILAKACDYIQELRASNQRMADNLKENERLALQAEVLRQQNEELRRDRMALHTQLAQNGISPCIDLVSPVIPNEQEILS